MQNGNLKKIPILHFFFFVFKRKEPHLDNQGKA
jgi:hypothetical protein